MNTFDSVYSLCGMCAQHCPIEISRKDGQAIWISGNPHSDTQGALCPRGAAGLALWQEDKRPQMPLVRVGKRGSGRWHECGWDEVIPLVAEKLRETVRRYGPQAVLWSERPNTCSDLNRAFVRALKCPNYCTHDVSCSHNVDQAAFSVSGLESTDFVYDYAHCRHVVFQGRNVFEAMNMAEVNAVLDAKERGCTLTAIDVRATVTASKADRFLLLRPGTDYALNLAVIHVLLHENLYNSAAVERHIRPEDMTVLRARVLSCTPEWAAHECAVNAQDIVLLARELAAAAPAVIWHPGWMTARYRQSFVTCRAAYCINALLGSIGAKGGLVPASPARLSSFTDLYPAPEDDKPASQRLDGLGRRSPHFSPQATLLHKALMARVSDEATAPYAVRTHIAFNHDPLTSLPDTALLQQRLDKLGTLICCTYSWSETSWYADIILPLSTPLECASLLVAQAGLIPRIYQRKAATPPQFDTLPAWDVVSRLADCMGFEKLAFSSIDDIWQAQLQGTGLDIAAFEAKGFVSLSDTPLYPELDTFPTPSGKLELFSSLWAQAGLDTLPPYTPCARPPQGKLRLVVGRAALHSQAHTQNNPLLAAEMPENVAWLHTDRAQEWDLGQGELVHIESASGEIGLVRVFCTEAIHPEALFLVHGFGHRVPLELQAYGRGIADNELMPGGLDKEDLLSQSLALQEHFVSIHKIQRDTV